MESQKKKTVENLLKKNRPTA